MRQQIQFFIHTCSGLILVLLLCGSARSALEWVDRNGNGIDTAVDRQAQIQYNRGNTHYRQARFNQAIEAYQQALALEPNFADAHYNLGNAYFQQGQLEEAIAAYQTVLRLRPDDVDAYNNLGMAYYQRGLWEQAVSTYQQALTINGKYARAHYNLAQIYEAQGMSEQAAQAWRQATRLDPDHYPLPERYASRTLPPLPRGARLPPEEWFAPTTGHYVGTPLEPEVIDIDRIDPAHYQLEAIRIDTPPRLDGYLDDPVWQKAQVAANFVQYEPDEGARSSQRTEVRVLYDETSIYFGVMCYDTEPDKIVARELKRDGRLWRSNDLVSIAIATFVDGRDAYFFQTNPHGARSDAYVGQEGANFDRDWNAIWEAEGKRHSQGWSVEIAIPFKSFRFPEKEEQVWSINFHRSIQRLKEDSYWVPVSRKDGFQGAFKFAKGGRLRGLKHIRPGRSLELLPYTVLGSLGERQIVSTSPVATKLDFAVERNLGGDLKWGITSNLTADLTLNPDFAQIEADDQIVNLTRFEFRFDEKRPFFLEGSDIFNLGRKSSSSSGSGGSSRRRRSSGGSAPQLFFSRRIGRQLADGTRVPIDLGAKVTGKLGNTNLGYLNAQTRETGYLSGDKGKIEPETNWQAFRVRQDILARSSLGIIGTSKEPEGTPDNRMSVPLPRFSGTDYNRVLGIDGSFAFQKTRHEFQFALARSWTDGKSSGLAKQSLWFVNQSWRNQSYNYQLSYTDIGEDFIDRMGFIPRTDIRTARASFGYTPLIHKYGIRSFFTSPSFEYIANHQDPFSDPETWAVRHFTGFQLEEGSSVFGGYSLNFDVLDKKTKITGVHFNAGEYRFDRLFLGFRTDPGKRLSGDMNISLGRQYGASLRNLSCGATVKPSDRLSFEWTLDWNRVERPDRIGLETDEFDFNSTLINRLRLNYSFTTELFLTTLVQFNSDKRRQNDSFHLNTFIINFLVAYRMDAGHTFFLALNQFGDDDLDIPGYDAFHRPSIRAANQTIVAKLSYLLNI